MLSVASQASKPSASSPSVGRTGSEVASGPGASVDSSLRPSTPQTQSRIMTFLSKMGEACTALPEKIVDKFTNFYEASKHAVDNAIEIAKARPTKVLVEAPAIAVTVTSSGLGAFGKAAQLANFAHSCFQTAVHVLGVASGALSIADGIRELVSAVKCHSRAQKVEGELKEVDKLLAKYNDAALLNAQVDLNQTGLEPQKLSSEHREALDLKTALETSQTVLKERSVDKAIVGCISIAVGIVGVVANVVTLGLAAPLVGLITWGSGQAVKVCLRAYRTHTSPPQTEINAAVKTLKQCQQAVKAAGTAFSVNVKDDRTLLDCQRNIFHAMRLNLSDDMKTDESIDKFTKNSTNFRTGLHEDSTKTDKAKAAVDFLVKVAC